MMVHLGNAAHRGTLFTTKSGLTFRVEGTAASLRGMVVYLTNVKDGSFRWDYLDEVIHLFPENKMN